MPPYIKKGGGGWPALWHAPRRGVLLGLPSPSRIPLQGREREGRRGRGSRKGGAPPFPCPIRTPGGRGLPWLPSSLSTKAHVGPLIPPGGSGNPSSTMVSSENSPEHFRCPNIAVQYINLYILTISRLLVMSVISSGTLNKLRSPKNITHNTNRH